MMRRPEAIKAGLDAVYAREQKTVVCGPGKLLALTAALAPNEQAYAE